MARNKYPELTVTKILEVSSTLFAEKGYDNVTIQDIVDRMDGLTKGAIYHHFKGKEEILEALIDNILTGENIFKQIDSIQDLSGLDKIREVVSWSAIDKGHTDISKIALSVLDMPQFLRKQLHNCVDIHARYIKLFIEQGNQDGSLSIAYPEAAAESFMILMNIWLNPGIFPRSYDAVEDKIKYLRALFLNIGLPVIDDRLEEQLKGFFKNMLNLS